MYRKQKSNDYEKQKKCTGDNILYIDGVSGLKLWKNNQIQRFKKSPWSFNSLYVYFKL